jgi:type VI secretion system secreted protein VgrG
MARMFELTTPLKDDQGKDLLLFRAMQAREELGRLPEFGISAVSTRVGIDPGALLGKKVTVKMELQSGGFREFNGHVTRFGQGGMVGRHHHYQMTVRPWLWFLTRTADCRVFQKKTAADIIRDVLTDKEYRAVPAFADGDPLAALTEKSKYPEREYCIQYRETDFNFVSRLLEEEGIYYFFVHKNGEAQLKLVDSLSGHKPLDHNATIAYFPPHRQTRADEEYIRTWTFAQHIQPGFVTLDDYDFKKPKANLIVTTGILESHDQADHEVFDYPGEYVNPDTVALDKILEQGDHYASARVNELHAEFDRAEAECNVREAAVGRLFTLENALRPDQDREYLILGASYQLLDNAYETSAAEPAGYDCRMTVLPSAQQFRPARITPEPRMNGPQTAVVVTHNDEDITCDEFGRIKVRFHWDREHKGKNDENASCFIRVAHAWAGARWGAIFLPRVGQEVLVHFLEGDPDQPLIMGSVYNADQMPPYDLPANKTQSGIKTRSTKEGGPSNFNEFRFEDKKGQEEVVLHAERNLSTSVEADESRSVGHDRSTTIGHDDTLRVKNKHTVTVKEGPAELFVDGNNRVVIVKQQYYLLADTIYEEGTTKVDIKSPLVNIGDNQINISGTTIVLSTDGGSITLDPAGVTIMGTIVKIN